MPDLELTDYSLLLLADLGCAGKRVSQRIHTLLGASYGTASKSPPGPLNSLVLAGLVEVRPTDNGYKIEITDKGLIVQSTLMLALREAVKTHA
jgi:hypothetical protein